MGVGRRDNRGERPYVITYIKGARRLADSATTLENAIARINSRLSKKRNKGEQAEVWRTGAGPATRVYTTEAK